MKIGLCASIDSIELLESIGFDYIEPSVVSIVQMNETEFEEAIKKVKDSGIDCEAFNVLFPGDARLTGPDVDLRGLREYLYGAFERVAKLGAGIVVFGSGGARRVPEGRSLMDGWQDLIETARTVGEVASQYDITIAMEPLNKGETNIINTVSEGIRFVNEVDHPNIRLLADFYHMRMENEPMDVLGQTTSHVLAHSHIARGQGRYYPLDRDEDIYGDFFGQLKTMGYKGGVSVEGKSEDILRDGAISLKLLRELAI